MRNLVLIYAVMILISLVYLYVVEDITGARFDFELGGKDAKFSFYDVSLIVVTAFSGFLTIVSTLAFGRKQSRKLFMVSVAFFVFTMRSAANVIFNHFIGGYYLLGVHIVGMEILVLLMFSSVLLFSEKAAKIAEQAVRKKK